jgi:acyl transferase domain-containing protein
VLGEASAEALAGRVAEVRSGAESGRAPARAVPAEAALRAPERLAIDYADAADLADKARQTQRVAASGHPAAWKMLQARGVFRGSGPAPKVAFLYPGQGSQYVNMLAELRATEPVVRAVFDEADQVMAPLLGRPLSEIIFADPRDPAALARAEEDLKQTAVTQPAVLTVDTAITRLLAAYGVRPDMVMGHSLGEYGALVAAGALPFAGARARLGVAGG